MRRTALSGRKSAAFWGWISYNGAGQIKKTGRNFNAVAYKRMLQSSFQAMKNLTESDSLQELVFQQDNNSIHAAKTTKDYLARKNFGEVLNWPARSPDLNIIENVWARMMQNWVAVRPRTEASIIDEVNERWAEAQNDRGIYLYEIQFQLFPINFDFF